MPWLAALGSAAGTAATGAASALGAGAGAAASGLGSALGSAGGALGSAAGGLSNTLGGALGSLGGELGAGGMGPMTGSSGFLGGLQQSLGGQALGTPGLGGTLGQLTGAGIQMRQGNRMGGLQSLASMTGMAGPATRQNSIMGQPHQQQKGLLSGLLSG